MMSAEAASLCDLGERPVFTVALGERLRMQLVLEGCGRKGTNSMASGLPVMSAVEDVFEDLCAIPITDGVSGGNSFNLLGWLVLRFQDIGYSGGTYLGNKIQCY